MKRYNSIFPPHPLYKSIRVKIKDNPHLQKLLIQFNTENFPTNNQVREVMIKTSQQDINKKFIERAEREAVSDIMREQKIAKYKITKQNQIKLIKKRKKLDINSKIVDKLDVKVDEYWPSISQKTLNEEIFLKSISKTNQVNINQLKRLIHIKNQKRE